MANYIKIASNTVGAGGVASVTFSSIPATYTDLVIRLSARTTTNPESSNWTSYQISFNGSATSFTMKSVFGTGSAASSNTSSGGVSNIPGWTNSSVSTASTFSNGEIYIPNYASSNNKSFSGDNVSEMNATAAIAVLTAGLWSNTAAITSITLQPPSGNWDQYSTFILYGIKNS